MATTNITVITTWVKVAESSNNDLLITFNSPVAIEIATTTADSAPTVIGHRLNNDSGITRAVIGAGYVWAKAVSGSNPSSITLIVSK